MYTLISFFDLSEAKIKKAIQSTFENTLWVKAFFNDSHHGYTHGNQVMDGCLKLIEKLNSIEKEQLLRECKNAFHLEPLKLAIISIKIASIFHDSGRFNDNGKIVAEEQKTHHIISFNRAKTFCENSGIDEIIPFIEDAIINHDFQSEKLTPHLRSPKSIIGKIVQSSDQMGWFHPDSIKRTLDYNNSLGIPFCDLKIKFEERLNWKPQTKSKDALTVMLNQLFGPIGVDRFGIESARIKVETYKMKLEENIIKLASEYKIQEEVKVLIEKFRS